MLKIIPLPRGEAMTIAALSWPEATVYITAIASVGLVVAVLVWSIFRTGRAAIQDESSRRVTSAVAEGSDQ
jgi:hypothetical protein